MAPRLPFECQYILGVDEVGLGAWAGPLCLGGVLAPRDFRVEGLRDSKRMTPRSREAAVDPIYQRSVDVLGALRSSDYILVNGQSKAWVDALMEVVTGLLVPSIDPKRVAIVVDGQEHSKARELVLARYPEVFLAFLIKAEDQVAQVAGASVLAKVYRDDLMVALSKQYPMYGWAKNKGYGVAKHAEALKTHRATKYHRAHAWEHWPR